MDKDQVNDVMTRLDALLHKTEVGDICAGCGSGFVHTPRGRHPLTGDTIYRAACPNNCEEGPLT